MEGLAKFEASENALNVLSSRYLRKENGITIETPEQMFWRVASHISQYATYEVAEVEESRLELARSFYDLMVSKRFIPNSPTFTGAGTPLRQLAACFVLPLEDDLCRGPASIFSTMHNAASIQQTGGGNGFSFGRLREKGSPVRSSSGKSSGPVSFLRVFDSAFGSVAQGGSRRGANMAVMPVDHPDIEEFVDCKLKEGDIANFNISVGISDAFMHAAIDDKEFDLISRFDGRVVRSVRARALFEKIVANAHRNGEPGCLFLDTINRQNPVPHLYTLEATNPCGEQSLGPYENCCLGSVNLAKHVKQWCEEGYASVDWELLAGSVSMATLFLDNVVTVNGYVPHVPQLREAANRCRRIGLGIMGLADLFFECGVRYGSPEAEDLAAQIMEFVRFHAMKSSIKLAAIRGPFPAIEGSVYDKKHLWAPPIYVPRGDYGRPELNWSQLLRDLAEHGIRNAAQTTIAPTGTIATISDCEGYGCEPAFALGYTRYVLESTTDGNSARRELRYTSASFRRALARHGLDESVLPPNWNGSCQQLDVPDELKRVFVVAGDITAQQHVDMQAALQLFVDNAISKTCNFPRGATVEDVAVAYRRAWERGCKGITVYVDGSREVVVLQTDSTASKPPQEPASSAPARSSSPARGKMLELPEILQGVTIRQRTPVGTMHMTINYDDQRRPVETYISTGKNSSDSNSTCEAIGRVMSAFLRVGDEMSQSERLQAAADQLRYIKGSRQVGFGPSAVSSIPEAIAKSIERYEQFLTLIDKPASAPSSSSSSSSSEQKLFDLCPDCKNFTLRPSEGCMRCTNCGFSMC